MDSLNKSKHIHFTNTIFKWFQSSINAKQNKITLTLETINLPDAVYQTDGYSCANFLCLYSYIASMLLMKYLIKDEWLVSFNDTVIKHINTDRSIMDFKKYPKLFCLLIKKERLCN